MAADTTTWDWERVDTVWVKAGGATWTTAIALAQHEAAYYLRVQTAKAGARDLVRVCIDGPYPDARHARAAVRRRVGAALDALAGACAATETGATGAIAGGR